MVKTRGGGKSWPFESKEIREQKKKVWKCIGRFFKSKKKAKHRRRWARAKRKLQKIKKEEAKKKMVSNMGRSEQ